MLAVFLAGAAPPSHTASAPTQDLVKAPALFQRAEPHLSAGARALESGDIDGALEHYKKAQPETDDERAIIEYDVGSALLMRAMLSAAPAPGAQGAAPSQHAGGQDPAPPDAPAGPDEAAIDDAKAAFDRAFGIAKDRRLKSEAALAAGNANAIGGKLDDAIAQYRKAIVADPSNARAKVNLKRALEAKRAQPPPPPKQDGDKNEDGEKKDGDEKKDDQEKKDGDDGDNKEPEEKPGDKKEDGDKQPEEKPGDAAAQKKKMKKDEARRMLEMMRSRERPLTPMEMRGQQKVQKPKNGKDW